MPGSPTLSLPDLRVMAERGEIDTVILAAPDMQGRLQGKRVMPNHFLSSTGAEGCAYLLATDVECRPVPGYEFVNWDQGFGDFLFTPDLGTLRLAPWQPGAAIVLCDIELAGHRPAPMAPRTVLRRQLERLAGHGLTAFAATELEFILFRNSYEEAWDKAYRGLTPANQYNNDYSHPRHRAGRAADPENPQRHGGGRYPGRELQGRVQSRPARDQFRLSRGDDHRGPACDLQGGGQGDRCGSRPCPHLHGKVQ